MKNEELIKDEESTDLNFGWYPRLRPIKEYIQTGVINLDKPPGPTSHEVVAWVKRLLSLDRAGHGGTLDPKVTGVLPITLGRATRLVSFIMKSGKEYVTIMELHGDVSDYNLKRVIEEFIGPIYQLPPIRSSVKRALRIRTINSIKILERIGKYVLMKVDCEAGTYIRKLCHDIGEVLGCGAHMKELRRIRAGPFTEKNSITLHSLLDAITLWKERNDESLLRRIILPIEETLLDIPKIYVRDSAVDALCHGANLASPGVLRISKNIKAGDFVCIMTLKGELIGIGKALKSSREILESDHGIVVDMERIVMEPGTYPKSWN
ncbi:MAG: RNA-guided pseudouridylation complex pseudouridine synthase subunit Cbf5 [Candidatus Methanomethyliaceae archaeon]|nr:RNA-guided pseudouridylation complex pseudouridine synthase subunit Cbf5 [Candidatus Methanomethyliaceae archaeon]MDW7970364.1 RNA-guided pseudouridylation complex pseudouridine synthase subunit Cbf5 [Nitrososphaerota archaeon]